jgi:hypothetical protein
LVAAPGILGALARITATSLLFSALYLAAVIFLHGGPDPLQRLLRLLPDMLPVARSRQPLPTPGAVPPSRSSACEDTAVVSEGFAARPEQAQ